MLRSNSSDGCKRRSLPTREVFMTESEQLTPGVSSMSHSTTEGVMHFTVSMLPEVPHCVLCTCFVARA